MVLHLLDFVTVLTKSKGSDTRGGGTLGISGWGCATADTAYN